MRAFKNFLNEEMIKFQRLLELLGEFKFSSIVHQCFIVNQNFNKNTPKIWVCVALEELAPEALDDIYFLFILILTGKMKKNSQKIRMYSKIYQLVKFVMT